MPALAVILIIAAVLILLPALAVLLLFYPLRRLNPNRVPNTVGEDIVGAVPYSVETTGGIPWLSVNGMPYPGSFARTDRRRFSLNGAWLLREDPEDRGTAEGWFAADLWTIRAAANEARGINTTAADAAAGISAADAAGLGGAEWKAVTVPSAYNPAAGNHTDYLGSLWYRKPFTAAELGVSAAPQKRRLRLCFEGILLRGNVWLNGEKLGSFEGGYTPLFFDITERIAEENTLTVRCDNRLTLDSLPPHLLEGHKPGWHTYAGVYRSVFIEELPETSVVKAQIRTRFDESGGGSMTVQVLGWSAQPGGQSDGNAGQAPSQGNGGLTGNTSAGPNAQNAQNADLRANKATAPNGQYANAASTAAPLLRFTLKDPDGNIVGENTPDSSGINGPGGTTAWKAEFPLKDILRWTPTPEKQTLYELNVELCRGGDVDRVVLKPGLREFSAEKDELRLNGDPIFLKGIGRHEDHPEYGATQPPEVIADDIKLITGMNANYVRLTHYPHCREELDSLSAEGLLFSEEIPLYQAGMGFTAWVQEKRPLREFPLGTFGLRQLARRGLLANARRQLIEMIERDRHSPALLFWSLANECYTLGNRSARIYSWLARTAKLFDPERPVTVVEATYARLGLDGLRRGWRAADILSVNSYYGWYFGSIEDVPGYLDGLRRRWPGHPFLLSEFGAGAAPGRSDADGEWRGERIEIKQTYSEEYQERVLKAYWLAAKERPWVAGYTPWVFADFYNIWFPGNPVPNYNLKGVVSRERKPKKSWYALKELYKEKREKTNG